MALDNFRDLSVGGADIGTGFQFEFFCNCCDQRWKSPFKPYRMGQITGLLSRFSFLFTEARTASRVGTNFTDMGSRGARDKALSEARLRAESLFTTCPQCRKGVCNDCFDGRKNLCVGCVSASRVEAEDAVRRNASDPGMRCPSCQQPHGGGRFCGECGFDMASTHKSCPGCGAMTQRAARYCTDCGHGF